MSLVVFGDMRQRGTAAASKDAHLVRDAIGQIRVVCVDPRVEHGDGLPCARDTGVGCLVCVNHGHRCQHPGVAEAVQRHLRDVRAGLKIRQSLQRDTAHQARQRLVPARHHDVVLL